MSTSKNLKTALIKNLGISASQFHSVVKLLDIPVKDVYTNDEAERIVAYVQSPVGHPKTAAPGSAPTSSAYHQRADHSAQTADTALSLLSQGSSQTLNHLKHHVSRVLERRNATVEQVSDTLAALHDPLLLEQEILVSAIAKIRARQQSSHLDSLDTYGEWSITVDLPALPSVPTVAGHLPL